MDVEKNTLYFNETKTNKYKGPGNVVVQKNRLYFIETQINIVVLEGLGLKTELMKAIRKDRNEIFWPRYKTQHPYKNHAGMNNRRQVSKMLSMM